MPTVRTRLVQFTPGSSTAAAADLAVMLCASSGRRIGLAVAPTDVDALTTVGWGGPLNYGGDTASSVPCLPTGGGVSGPPRSVRASPPYWVSVAEPLVDQDILLPGEWCPRWPLGPNERCPEVFLRCFVDVPGCMVQLGQLIWLCSTVGPGWPCELEDRPMA